MNYLVELRTIASANGGIINTKAAEAIGISRAMLSKLHKKNVIERIAQGQYVLAEDMADELLSIMLHSNNLVFSHETALFLNGISDRTPFEHSVTVSSDKRPPATVKELCKVYYIKPELFALGLTTLKTNYGNEVRVYDLERTICDCVRSRSRMGSETFLFALRMYAKRPDKNLNKLNTYAKALGISGVVRQYLEVLI